jgi:hypothetical protein
MTGILVIAGMVYNNPLVVTGQLSNNETAELLLSSRTVHNTTVAGDRIVHRGIAFSEVPKFLVPEPGEENQSVEILRHRPDEATYVGVLTLQLQNLPRWDLVHRVHLNNSTISQLDPEKIGTLYTRLHINSSNHITPGIISAPTRIMPNYGNSPPHYSASIPFVGSSVFLTTSGEPFVAVYEVVAEILQPQIILEINGSNSSTIR